MGVANEPAVEAVARPPELERSGADPDQRIGLVRVHRRLPELVAAASAHVEELRAAALARGVLARSLERLPAVGQLAGNAGRDREHGDDRQRHEEGGKSALPRNTEPAGARPVAHEESEPGLDERHPGAHDEHDRDHLVALLLRGRGRKPAVERVALLDRGEQDRRPAARDQQRRELRDAIGRQDEEHEQGARRNRHEQARAVSQSASATSGRAPAASA